MTPLSNLFAAFIPEAQRAEMRAAVESLVRLINEWDQIPNIEMLREQRLTPVVIQLQRQYPEIRTLVQQDTGLLLNGLGLLFPDLRQQLRDPKTASEVIERVRKHFDPGV